MYSLFTGLLGQLFKILGIFVVLMFVGFAFVLFSEVPSYLSSKADALREEENALRESISAVNEQLAGVQGELKKKRREIDLVAEDLAELDRKRKWWAHRLTHLSMKEYHAEKASLHAKRSARKQELQKLKKHWRQASAAIPGTKENQERLDDLSDRRERAEEQASDIEEITSDAKARVLEAFPVVLKYALGGLAVIFLLPILWKLLMYFGVAKVLERARPIVLDRESHGMEEQLAWSESRPAQSFSLKPDEHLLVKTDYLQSSEESLTKSSKLLWSWEYLFSSLAAKLSLLTHFTNRTSDERSVTLSDMEDGVCELASVELPEGASLVVRPSFLVGARFMDQQPRVRTKWKIFSLHAWITFQFRYFIFSGPCVLIFSAGRGLQPEYLNAVPRAGEKVGKRINEGMMVAFTPTLSYGSRRAETAIAGYVFGDSSLFDDYFEGAGSFAAQQVRSGRQAANRQAEGFFEKIFGLIGKLIGI